MLLWPEASDTREHFSSPQVWSNLPFALDQKPGILEFQSLLFSVLKKRRKEALALFFKPKEEERRDFP